MLAVVLLSLCASACRPPEAPPVVSESSSHPAVPAPIAVLPDGARITLELALTPEEITQGLMYRPSLAADRGMLFLFEAAYPHRFWMKNTLIPLDIIFLDEHGTVVDLVAGAQPCHSEPCPTFTPAQPVSAVLELSVGTAAAHGLTRMARVTFVNVPEYVRPSR